MKVIFAYNGKWKMENFFPTFLNISDKSYYIKRFECRYFCIYFKIKIKANN